MENTNSNLFDAEKALIKEARELIDNKNYDEKTLIDMFNTIIDQFNKLVRDAQKIIKISDGQQEYLHRIQIDLKKEIEDRIRAEEKLKYVAAIDSLTGCYNRGMGIAFLENEINNIRRNKGHFSVCYIDINGLKYVNDNFGHFEGDELIVMTCRFIKEVISESDILCRLGGDEFLVLFPNSKEENIEKTLNTIVSNIENENKKKLKPYNISFSYGVIQVDADDNYSIDYIIQLADAKMYKCKEKYKIANLKKTNN